MTYIVTVRGILKATDEQEAQAAHDATVERLSQLGKSLGSTGHRAFLNPQNRQEFLAVDTWSDMEGLQKFMSDPANPGAAIAELFEDEADVVVWVEAGWQGY